MNPFNPKIPMMIKVKNDPKLFKRRKKEVTDRGTYKIVEEGKIIENGYTIQWLKLGKNDREER